MDNVKLLVTKSQKGDTRSFEQLVTMYQDKIFALSYQLTGNYADAQDLAQNVFIKAYRALPGFRNEADFGTWLHRITVNLSINEKRKKKPEVYLDSPVQTGEGEMPRMVASDIESPEEAFEKKEFSSMVHAALWKLSEEHRAVLVLREMQGYSYEEIAQMLDCTLGTVKSRISRARHSLKMQLSQVACNGRKKQA
ncbi:RNA polymerase, sigma-24 subunit, RpoE [Desulfotomaculum arcticum]|uniref:RNA polymerase sigma factor n=1 Tax=Desulfotruncus arcticus DSM 17038 TaxID=1121424 RepID=A0A1I2X0X0_9FIRM|nr:sigma-70 family RNA polymerase sigma factor [Desulfotruncus arcticus]SFH06529.1 RNA polymerase, sigma-24 subunit, RpoE [Desulfotomaculum arcticum] [Desulfotruncus arcticus DSM 17038]